MSILIKNGIIVTMNANRDVIKGDILIKKNKIKKIGTVNDENVEHIINASGRLVIPGMIQSHIHLCQVLFRGMADDLELLDWLKQRIWPLEGSHDDESIYYSALLGCGELLRGGTTSIIDMASVHHTEGIFEAVKQAGIRYLGGKCLMDKGMGVPGSLLDSPDNAIQESLELYHKWNNKENGRIRYALCPRFAISCSNKLLLQTRDLAKEYNIPVHTHASENRDEITLVEKEYGMPNVLYLNSLGLCNKNLILAHCIHINNEEMKILAESQTNIIHCPSANLKLASGIAQIPQLMDIGANISLGADGAPCNNNLNIFMEMRLAALIHKPFNGPTSMPAEKVFELATLGGAKAMGLEDEIGSLEVGKKADIVLVDLGNWHTQPESAASVYTHLVYQAQASDVYATIVDGQIVMLNDNVLSINAKEVKEKAAQSLMRVQKRAGIC